MSTRALVSSRQQPQQQLTAASVNSLPLCYSKHVGGPTEHQFKQEAKVFLFVFFQNVKNMLFFFLESNFPYATFHINIYVS